jgi:hypothetical protein
MLTCARAIQTFSPSRAHEWDQNYGETLLQGVLQPPSSLTQTSAISQADDFVESFLDT